MKESDNLNTSSKEEDEGSDLILCSAGSSSLIISSNNYKETAPGPGGGVIDDDDHINCKVKGLKNIDNYCETLLLYTRWIIPNKIITTVNCKSDTNEEQDKHSISEDQARDILPATVFPFDYPIPPVNNPDGKPTKGVINSSHKSIARGLYNSNSSDISATSSWDSETNTTGPPDKMKEDRSVEIILKSLLSGGVAGMCAKTCVAPLDRMKILLQAHSKHYAHLGVFSGLKGIVEKERFMALYKGNGAQMVRIFPYAATQFTSFEMYKKLFGETSHVGRFAAGSCAGVTAVALTYPLDTIRARLAFQVSGEHVYNGIYQCATQIFQNEGGIRALYRGFTPTIFGMIPYAGFSFYCFESFKYLCMKYFPDITCKPNSTNTGGLVLMLPYKLLCGGVAGAAAQTFSYPLDVTRRRMQLAMMNEATKKFGMGMVTTLKVIYEENGIVRGLYRGMSINFLRAIPTVAVSFSTYELMKQMLNLDTGLQIKTG